MDILSVGGLVLAFTMFIVAFFMEGGTFESLLQPTSAMIVFGGTIGTIMVSFPMTELKKLGKCMKIVFFNAPVDRLAIIDKLSELGDKARRSGILSLEEEIPKQDNMLIKKGLELIMSGLDKDLVYDALSRQAEIDEKDLDACAAIFEAAGGYSPTMGIIGTVMGMISVLSNISGGAEELGHSIAVAFVATLYGVCFANVVYLAFGRKIKTVMKNQMAASELIVEGIVAIQAGENPKVMKDKLGYETIAELEGVDLEARNAAIKAAQQSAKAQQ